MVTKRAGIPKPKPELYFEQVPLALVKTAVIVPGKKPKTRRATRRPVVAGK